MKKIFTMLGFTALLFLLLPAASTNASAAQLETESLVSSTTTQLENGDSLVTEITVIPDNTLDTGISLLTTSTKTAASKTVTYRNSKGAALWYFKMTASFSYTGTSSMCTAVSTCKQINDSAWKLTNITSSRSSNVAKASVTAKECLLGVPFYIVTENLQLKCSAKGVIS